jgi:hypothetical protein
MYPASVILITFRCVALFSILFAVHLFIFGFTQSRKDYAKEQRSFATFIFSLCAFA